jgi:hypothetical protein
MVALYYAPAGTTDETVFTQRGAPVGFHRFLR